MTTPYTHTLSLSLGGDVPTWEGEAEVSFTFVPGGAPTGPTYDSGGDPGWPPEIEDLRIERIDGKLPDPHEADTLISHIEGSDRLQEELIEYGIECDAARFAEDFDRKAEQDAERVRG